METQRAERVTIEVDKEMSMFSSGKQVVAGWLAAAVLVLLVAAAQAEAAGNFRVRLADRIDGKTVKPGHPVHATLSEHIVIGGLNFPPGSQLTGTITKAQKARRFIQAEVSPKRWLKPGGAISMHFTRIAGGGMTARLNAVPIGVSSGQAKAKHDGRIESASKGQVRSKVGRLALTGLSFVAAPVAPLIGGAVGVVKPDAVLPDAYDSKGRKHRRLKGMAAGAIAGVPGGFLINDTMLKGRDIYIQPGTELLLQNSSAPPARGKDKGKGKPSGGNV